MYPRVRWATSTGKQDYEVISGHLGGHLRARPDELGRVRPRPARSWRGRRAGAEVEQLIREGIAFHLEGLAKEGLPIPDPDSIEVETVAV